MGDGGGQPQFPIHFHRQGHRHGQAGSDIVPSPNHNADVREDFICLRNTSSNRICTVEYTRLDMQHLPSKIKSALERELKAFRWNSVDGTCAETNIGSCTAA